MRLGPYTKCKHVSFLRIGTTSTVSLAALPLLANVLRHALRFHLTANLSVAIVITAVLATVFAFSLQVWAQRHTTPTTTARLIALEPIFAVVTSFFVLGERLGARTSLGGLHFIPCSCRRTERAHRCG